MSHFLYIKWKPKTKHLSLQAELQGRHQCPESWDWCRSHSPLHIFSGSFRHKALWTLGTLCFRSHLLLHHESTNTPFFAFLAGGGTASFSFSGSASQSIISPDNSTPLFVFLAFFAGGGELRSLHGFLHQVLITCCELYNTVKVYCNTSYTADEGYLLYTMLNWRLLPWSMLVFLLQKWCLHWGRWECGSWCLCCGRRAEEELPTPLCHPCQGPSNLPKDPLQEVAAWMMTTAE